MYDAGLGRHRSVHRDGVEAVVVRDIAGQRVIAALLRLEHND
jgi:hypothetical protein